ncbi:Antitoxin (plasmid) [Rhodovastum atsumiense]|uniref:Antitoxin n=1 Tax=Rhodovastum atsumiense TaxID=504468 RepID=A0A5M6IJ35_9PROT|nr:type II toxin-antitoxin system prevent-host-death family antitoxin [Rhodovastum atsumiense]KAA5608274.1 type II toxin-antitoxin system Phd/YefM family antitoxin [Rhodovastum atsumiense]CAH2605695.1 Antitoxin [Rhodovastum atsumiense]
MSTGDPVVTTAGELVRQFSHYSDIALKRPVMVTKNGRPRTVLLSVEEYERLKRRDQQAFQAVLLQILR